MEPGTLGKSLRAGFALNNPSAARIRAPATEAGRMSMCFQSKQAAKGVESVKKNAGGDVVDLTEES